MIDIAAINERDDWGWDIKLKRERKVIRVVEILEKIPSRNHNPVALDHFPRVRFRDQEGRVQECSLPELEWSQLQEGSRFVITTKKIVSNVKLVI